MARRFKKKLAQRKIRTREKPVFSINLIGKEYFKKLNSLRRSLISKVKSFKLAN